VEFYEKLVNLGIVKLDFYYTKGTVKTTLHHPNSGPNPLFRRCRVYPDLYRKILHHPRVHTGIGYRFQGAAPGQNRTQLEEEEDGDVDDEQEQDFDVPMDMEDGEDDTPPSEGDAAMMEFDDNDPAGTSSGTAVYFAKNGTYNFQQGGHQNRRAAMDRLATSSREYQAWLEASRMECACIHAKFYVALPQPRSRIVLQRSKGIEPEPLPSPAPIVDIKAAERATLSTNFQATGPV
jgi:hypothetical protein